jgi:hypothetical protein
MIKNRRPVDRLGDVRASIKLLKKHEEALRGARQP